MSTALGAERTLRPLRHLAWRSAVAGNIAVVAPGALVALLIAAQDGHAATAAPLVVTALVVAIGLLIPVTRIRTRLDPDGITTFSARRLGPTHLRRNQVKRAVVRTVYNSDGVSTNRHLFLLDDGDRTLHRMDDRWWDDEQLITVAQQFGVTLESQNQPMHLAELRRTVGEQLRWTERHRLTADVAIVIGTFLLCVVFAALATAAL